MNIFGVIDKKRMGNALSKEELELAFMGYLKGKSTLKKAT